MMLHEQFGLENLPYCMFGEPARPGMRYGDGLIDLRALFDSMPANLNELFRDGRERALEFRDCVRGLIEVGGVLPMVPAAGLRMPFAVGNFIDFYSSREHAENVGRLFRDPSNPLPENWLHLPAGYNGRASNVVVSGEPVRRPWGQYRDEAGELVFGPTRQLDLEVEMGYFLCPGACDQLAGFVLLNDWSARDMQRWEYVPLGPFLSKGFATSVSPYVVLPEALDAVAGPLQEPPVLPHLRVDEPRNFAVTIEASIGRGGVEVPLGRMEYARMYWSHGQQLAHLRSAAIKLCSGDLIGSGTISGPDAGSLLERGGPFLEDGDEVVLRGYCGKVGFGELRNRVYGNSSC